MKKLLLSTFTATASVLFMTTGAQAEGFSVGAGLDYSSGKYGNATSTDILYMPVTVKYEADKWSLKLTAPWLRISGPGNVVGGADAPIVVNNQGNAQRRTVQGQGDIVAAGTYSAYENTQAGVLVDLTGKIKFATADKNQGLGTGENDYAVQADVYKTLQSVTVFGGYGYRWMGKPAGANFRDIQYGSVGVGKKWDNQTSMGLVYDYRQSVIASRSAQQDITAYVSRKFDPRLKGQLYVSGGLTNSSPAYGVGAMLNYSF